MNKYLGYFQVAIGAHFAAMLLALYRLYETRSDTHNIPGFIDRVEKDGVLNKADAETARSQYAAIKPLWIKVSILRNNIYGHRSAELTVEEVFKQAGVTPFEFRDLVAKTKELLNFINLKVRDSTHAFNLTATRDTVRMLEDLKS